MDYSSDDTAGSQYTRLEVAPREQGAAYTPGNGDVIFLNDKTTRAMLFNSLTETECRVMAARFISLAEMAESAANTHTEAAQ
jgi:hypothetical protein